MLPVWMLIAQGVKQIADNQNEQANTQANTQANNTQSNQPVNNNNAFSTISSIYNNYLDNDSTDKKKNWFSQIFGNR
jgi:predicted double-glycine peptidase